jgi:hypothetical protein
MWGAEKEDSKGRYIHGAQAVGTPVGQAARGDQCALDNEPAELVAHEDDRAIGAAL